MSVAWSTAWMLPAPSKPSIDRSSALSLVLGRTQKLWDSVFSHRAPHLVSRHSLSSRKSCILNDAEKKDRPIGTVTEHLSWSADPPIPPPRRSSKAAGMMPHDSMASSPTSASLPIVPFRQARPIRPQTRRRSLGDLLGAVRLSSDSIRVKTAGRTEDPGHAAPISSAPRMAPQIEIPAGILPDEQGSTFRSRLEEAVQDIFVKYASAPRLPSAGPNIPPRRRHDTGPFTTHSKPRRWFSARDRREHSAVVGKMSTLSTMKPLNASSPDMFPTALPSSPP